MNEHDKTSNGLGETDIQFQQDRREAERTHWAEAPAQFLDAWKRAVHLAGPRYFNILSDTVESAVSPDDLAPDFDAIDGGLGVLSRGEAWFLLQLYGFYNGRGAQDLAERHGRADAADVWTGDNAGGKDLEYRKVLADLIVNYTGW